MMSEYIEYLKEALAEFGEIRPRKMFGGYGPYHDVVLIGLVAADPLYLQVDFETV